MTSAPLTVSTHAHALFVLLLASSTAVAQQALLVADDATSATAFQGQAGRVVTFICPSTAKRYREDVSFLVPLNLTKLSRYIERVAVTCRFGDLSDPRIMLSSTQEIPVTAGQVVGELQIVIAIDPYATTFKPGQTLNYECTLSGLISSSSGDGTTAPPRISGWFRFDDRPDLSVALSPTPVPITDTVVW